MCLFFLSQKISVVSLDCTLITAGSTYVILSHNITVMNFEVREQSVIHKKAIHKKAIFTHTHTNQPPPHPYHLSKHTHTCFHTSLRTKQHFQKAPVNETHTVAQIHKRISWWHTLGSCRQPPWSQAGTCTAAFWPALPQRPLPSPQPTVNKQSQQMLHTEWYAWFLTSNSKSYTPYTWLLAKNITLYGSFYFPLPIKFWNKFLNFFFLHQISLIAVLCEIF